MPFSRSRSIESITRSATSWFSRKAPDCHSIASTSVVLPWSTWATIATLRMSSRWGTARDGRDRLLPSRCMAVAIASGLGKNVAGNPLLRGVSFKVERRERLALSGRNGSGKTTLLRMLAGETPIDAGELSLEKGARVALHDQRPPRERDLTLRDYVLSGCADLVELEEQLDAARAGDGVRRLRSGDARRLCDRPGAARARRRI